MILATGNHELADALAAEIGVNIHAATNTQTYDELRASLAVFIQSGNHFAVKATIGAMASLRGVTARVMAASIAAGEDI